MENKGRFNWRPKVLLPAGFLMAFMIYFVSGCGSTNYAPETAAEAKAEQTTDDMTYLMQYGNWDNVPPYGDVWVPSVGNNWAPFSSGHWTSTDSGWAWVSYEPYGWLVYHYGTWGYRPDVGWFWIEGHDWSPAPVEWDNFDNYTAWAPIPPDGEEWGQPWDEAGFDPWVVVPDDDFDREDVGTYRMPQIPEGQHVDREHMSHKPLSVRDVEKRTGRSIHPRKLQHDSVPIYMRNRKATNEHEGRSDRSRAEAGRNENTHLQRMVLSPKDQDRVRRNQPRVEREIMRPKKAGNESHAEHDRDESNDNK